MDRPGPAKPSEKRKVGGSTPPLTTTSDQAILLAEDRLRLGSGAASLILVSFGAHKKVFSRSAMSRRSLAVTYAYRLTITAFDQPMTSITARSETPRSNKVVAAV